MIVMTLVHGGSQQNREHVIATLTATNGAGVIIEGLPDGTGRLEALANSGQLQLQRIAPGCPCCLGNLTVRVTLNRMLRQNLPQIYLGISDPAHLPAIRTFLQEAQYRDHLVLGPEVDCSA